MPAPLSLDIRRRFQRLIEGGESGRGAARRLLLSPATGVRLAAKVRRGESLAPARCGRPEGVGKLTAHQAFLVELVEQDPDITLPELRDALEMAAGVRAHPTSISRTLRRLGFSYKKNRWRRTSGAALTSPAPAASG